MPPLPLSAHLRGTITPASILLAGVMVLVGAGLSEIAAEHAQSSIEAQADERFDLQNKRLHDEIKRRMTMPLYGLGGARGVYAASRSVERNEFRAYAASRDMNREFPGILGFGFVKHVLRSEVDSFIASEQADDAADFTIKGSSTAADLFVVTSIEPLALNQAARGLDAGADATRRAAIERAVASGEPAMTGAITLVQDGAQTPGCLMLMPVYRNGSHPHNAAERQQALLGLVYAPVILDHLLKHLERITDDLTSCRITLISDEAPTTAVYATPDSDASAARQARFTLPFGGQTLSIDSQTTARFEATVDQRPPWLIRLGGGSVSVLLAGMFWLLARGRSRAEARAGEMTLDLQAAHIQLQNALREAQGFAADLLRTSRTLQSILDSATGVAVVATDTAGLIQTFNVGAELMLGHAASDIIGRHTPDIFHAADEVAARGLELSRELGRPISGFAVFVAKVQAFDSQESREWTYVRKNGSRVTVQLCVTAMRDASGTISGYLGVAHDLSARKAYEHGLAEATRAAEALAQARISFLANMSHEIRTPLNGMLGMTELLLATRLDTEQNDYARTAYQSGESLMTIINDILDFSKIEADHLELEAIAFDLHRLIYTVTDLFRPRLPATGLELLVRIAADAPSQVLDDPGRVRQILTNLVSNALKFTSRGHVLIELTWHHERFYVAVIDSGIGIDGETLGRLFTAFEQADSSTSRCFGGTGLGLAISRRLARLMHGEVSAISSVGSGSTFTVELPLPTLPGSPPPLPSMPALTVLIVDGNAVNCRIVAEQLTRLGLRSATCATAAAALVELSAMAEHGEPYTAILLDQHVPTLSGSEFSKALPPQLGHPPVILMSAVGRQIDVAQLKQASIAGYVTKPTRTEVLADVLLSIFQQSRHQDYEQAVVTPYTVAATPAAAPAPARPSTGAVVLLADDSPINQRIGQLMLRKMGFEVHIARDGREAVDLSARHAYAIIFMDCQMPEMDGFQATAAIRAHEEKAGTHTPIIALTANAMRGDRELCLAAGMDDYLAKPMREKDLAAMAQRWLKPA